MRVLRPALVYAGLVFAVGFVLGTARVLAVAPALGEAAAVAIELPFMLFASWLAAGWLVRRFAMCGVGEGLATGAAALVMLLAAELALGIAAFSQSPENWVRGLSRPAGLLGLTGQLAFALMPWLRARRLAGSQSL